ncbi:MAG TPA: cation-efflux pump [Terriglobales bacterium]|nr:cation-efflux pump [Terriglobales bacterium]
MSATEGVTELQHVQMEKRGVALNSVYVAVVITGLKLWVGFSTGSLGILSEAAHSGLDFIAALITYFSVRVSDRPADADHQYGHGKVENFSAFLETGLLLVTCVWIVWEAVHRLTTGAFHLEPTAAAFGVLILSMVLDYWRSHRLQRIAVKYDSQALEADALHFNTDIWSSGVVVIGLVLVWAGHRWNIPALSMADPIAALLVAGVIIHVSWRLARQTIDALLDAAPAGVRAQISTEVATVPDVMEVDRVRIRRAGNRYFADVSVAMSRRVTFQRSEQVVGAVTDAIHRVLPNADVLVRSIPRAAGTENIFDRIRGVATNSNYSVHDVSVQDLGGRIHVEQHLELDESLSLKQAHDVVTRLEAEIKEQIPEVSSILTHIESEPNTVEKGDEIFRDPNLEQRLRTIVREFPEVIDIHELIVKKVRGMVYLSCHVTMADDLPLSRVHDISTSLEIRFKQAAPELFKVLIHTEPQTDNTR